MKLVLLEFKLTGPIVFLCLTCLFVVVFDGKHWNGHFIEVKRKTTLFIVSHEWVFPMCGRKEKMLCQYSV